MTKENRLNKKYSVGHQDKTASPGNGVTTLGGGTAILGGGMVS